MDTPEAKRDAELRALGIEPHQLTAFADLQVTDLDLPVQALDLPDPAEIEWDNPGAGPAHAPAAPRAPARGGTSKSVPITIRIPHAVLEGFKEHAARSGEGYQTVMVRSLREWLRART